MTMLAIAAGRIAHPPTPAHRQPLIAAADGEPTVAVVLATRPGPALGVPDRRRLAQRIQGARRRLRRTTLDAASRERLTARLVDVAAAARDLPVGDGLAVVASADDAALVHLRHPVRTRVLIGPAPNRVDLAEVAATPERLAILGVSLDRARLLVTDRGVLRDVLDAGLPISRRRCRRSELLLPDYLEVVEASVVASLPPAIPLVVAGDERVAAAFAERYPDRARIAAVLDGDHRATSPMALLTLAHRALERTLTLAQRRALAEVAVAAGDGRLVAGADAVQQAVPWARHALLVVERGFRSGVHGRDDDFLLGIATRVHDGGGRVVVVPDGRLAEHGRIALVSDDRPVPPR